MSESLLLCWKGAGRQDVYWNQGSVLSHYDSVQRRTRMGHPALKAEHTGRTAERTEYLWLEPC